MAHGIAHFVLGVGDGEHEDNIISAPVWYLGRRYQIVRQKA
jgi:hypothetical protein